MVDFNLKKFLEDLEIASGLKFEKGQNLTLEDLQGFFLLGAGVTGSAGSAGGAGVGATKTAQRAIRGTGRFVEGEGSAFLKQLRQSRTEFKGGTPPKPTPAPQVTKATTEAGKTFTPIVDEGLKRISKGGEQLKGQQVGDFALDFKPRDPKINPRTGKPYIANTVLEEIPDQLVEEVAIKFGRDFDAVKKSSEAVRYEDAIRDLARGDTKGLINWFKDNKWKSAAIAIGGIGWGVHWQSQDNVISGSQFNLNRLVDGVKFGDTDPDEATKTLERLEKIKDIGWASTTGSYVINPLLLVSIPVDIANKQNADIAFENARRDIETVKRKNKEKADAEISGLQEGVDPRFQTVGGELPSDFPQGPVQEGEEPLELKRTFGESFSSTGDTVKANLERQRLREAEIEADVRGKRAATRAATRPRNARDPALRSTPKAKESGERKKKIKGVL